MVLIGVLKIPFFGVRKCKCTVFRHWHIIIYTDNCARTFLEKNAAHVFKRVAFKTLRVSFKTNFLSYLLLSLKRKLKPARLPLIY